MNDSLGDRMKTNYENINRTFLVRRMPVIIRLDGKAFHTLTKGLDKPWDASFGRCMRNTAIKLCEEIQNVEIAYVQSDEISLLLNDYKNLGTMQWFDGNIQKIVSVSASIASVEFTRQFGEVGIFDSRVFNIPKEEVCNYFIWRQNDASRNSVQSLAQSHFSHKELHGLGLNELQDKLFKEKNINWNNEEIWNKRVICIVKRKNTHPDNYILIRTFWDEDYAIPEFTKDRNYIEQYI